MKHDYTITPLDIKALGPFLYGDILLAPKLVVRIVKVKIPENTACNFHAKC